MIVDWFVLAACLAVACTFGAGGLPAAAAVEIDIDVGVQSAVVVAAVAAHAVVVAVAVELAVVELVLQPHRVPSDGLLADAPEAIGVAVDRRQSCKKKNRKCYVRPGIDLSNP